MGKKWTEQACESAIREFAGAVGHFPTTAELRAAGRVDLLKALNKNGGLLAWSKRIGVNRRDGVHDGQTPSAPKENVDYAAAILARLKRKGLSPPTFEELCDAMNAPPNIIRGAILQLQQDHFDVTASPAGVILLGAATSTAASDTGRPSASIVADPGQTIRFGFVTDSHCCNINYRGDVAEAMYDRFVSEGITTVFHAGNTVDGEASFNRTELVVPPGFERQIDHFIDVYPRRDGITTYFIDGDDHEGWYSNKHGICFGKRLQQTAEERGRDDLIYLGYQRADVAYVTPSGAECRVRIEHPGMGSAYADSYMVQKMVEAIDPEKAPAVLLYGHYHKSIYDHVRRIHTICGGCLCDQTVFMRKKRLRADVGGWMADMDIDAAGRVTRFQPSWFPFPAKPAAPVATVQSGGAFGDVLPAKLTLNY